MAFQCEECLAKEIGAEAARKTFDMALLQSLGPCEDCRRTRVCIDC